MNKIWHTAEPISPEFQAQFPEIPKLVLQLLHNRDLTTQEQIDEFLEPDYSQDVHNPYLFCDMKKAVERIFQAIQKDELIIVHGDYDADGVCAAVILISTLKKLGAKHLDIFLPDRESEGYGINKNTVEIIAAAGAKLLISCDCGISSKDEIALANKLGMDVIVTDHHAIPPELPPAFAIIHPKVEGETYPDKGLSGGGVAFKLSQALLNHANKNNDSFSAKGGSASGGEKWLLDLVAISSVADMVPLIGETRTLTKYGLIVLNRTRRPGLRHLIELAGLNKQQSQVTNLQSSIFNLSARHIAFQIAPRINAAGRLKHANSAYQMLLAEDKDEAMELARELNHNNQERQKITEEMVKEAKLQIRETNQENASIIFILKKNWPLGLVGLIASKLCNEYNKPALVMTEREDGIHGSGRSIDEINIIEKLQKLSQYLEKFGGHPQACGFNVKNSLDTNTQINANDANHANENYEQFKTELTALVEKDAKNKDLTPVLSIDAEVKLDDITWEMYDVLQKFEPFGENNPEPLYMARGVTVQLATTIGSDGRHLKLLATHATSKSHKIIGFSFADESSCGCNWAQVLKPGDKIDVVFNVSVNEWNGNRELQMKIVDLRKTALDTNTQINTNDANHANVNVANVSDENNNIIYPELSFKINGILFDVHNKLGRYCNEKQVCDAIEQELKDKNFKYEREKKLPPSFTGERFGRNKIDFIVEELIILEAKCVNFTGKEEYYQCLRYLEAFDKKLCLLVNFRDKHLKIKRILNPKSKV